MRQDAQIVEIPIWIDLLAVFAGGVAASLLATKKDFDITGVLMLTIVAALGGGIIRDTLIQRGTPAALMHSSYLLVAFAAAGVGFFFARPAASLGWAVTAVDAAALGLYTLVGVLKAFAADLPIPSVLLIGVLATAGGGIMRDILLNKTPDVLLPGAPYAVLSLIGGLIAVVLHETGATEAWLWWLPVVVVIVLRLTSLRFGWQTPQPIDVPAHVRSISRGEVHLRIRKPAAWTVRRRRAGEVTRTRNEEDRND